METRSAPRTTASWRQRYRHAPWPWLTWSRTAGRQQAAASRDCRWSADLGLTAQCQHHGAAVPLAARRHRRLSRYGGPCSPPHPTAQPPNPPTAPRRRAGRPDPPHRPGVPGDPAWGPRGAERGRGPSSGSPGTTPPTPPQRHPDGTRRPARPPRQVQGVAGPAETQPTRPSGERVVRRGSVVGPSPGRASRAKGHLPGQTHYYPPSNVVSYCDKIRPLNSRP